MTTRAALQFSLVAATSLFLLTLGSAKVVAASIDLGNDVNINWSNDLDCNDPKELLVAQFPKIVCSIPVIGAPRLVPDARNSGSSVKILVDLIESEVADAELILNVGDSNLNEIFLPGASDPLTLRYQLPSGAYDFLGLVLANFDGFDELPAGDLVFSVGGRFLFDLPGREPFFPEDRKDPGARITLSGPGTVLSVPEPGVLSLLLCGLTGAALGTTRRRRTGCGGPCAD